MLPRPIACAGFMSFPFWPTRLADGLGLRSILREIIRPLHDAPRISQLKAKRWFPRVAHSQLLKSSQSNFGSADEYRIKENEKRADNHIPSGEPIIFLEVIPGDASEFAGVLKVKGGHVDGFRILRTESPAVPNAIAAFLLHLRDKTGKLPHIYFGWSEGNPLYYLLKYVAFGEGDTAPVTHEVLRQAEEDPERRPNVHVGG